MESMISSSNEARMLRARRPLDEIADDLAAAYLLANELIADSPDARQQQFFDIMFGAVADLDDHAGLMSCSSAYEGLEN